MAYTENIPQSGDNPSDSQPLILANFEAISSLVEVNHVGFNTGDSGKHNFMQMPEQGSAPTTAANEGALYTKEVSGATELFFRRESDGSELQLTGAETSGANGFFEFPGGIKLIWGTATTISVATDITIATSLTTLYSAVFTRTQATAPGTDMVFTAGNFTAPTTLRVYRTSSVIGNVNIYYMITGV